MNLLIKLSTKITLNVVELFLSQYDVQTDVFSI